MLVILSGGSNFAAEWTIPLAGNAYRTEPTPGNEGFSRQGPIRFGQRNEVISVFFHVNTESKLNLAIKASAIDASAKVTAILEDQKFDSGLGKGHIRIYKGFERSLFRDD